MPAADIFDLNIKRSRALVATHVRLHNKQGKPATVVTDVMRASVVMAVSAFDALLHGLLKEYVLEAAAKSPPPAALIALIRDWKLDAPTQLAFMLHSHGPSDLQTRVEQHFADRTLQDPSKVILACEVLGIPAIWTDVAHRLGVQEPALRQEFAAIVKRRHCIAHEADLDPNGRTRFKKKALPRDVATQYIDQIQKIGLAIIAALNQAYP